MTSGLVIGLGGSLATVLVALLAWFGGRRLQAATAEKTTGEGWDLLTTGMAARLTTLQNENTDLRASLYREQEENALMRRTMIENGIPIPVRPAGG